MPVVFVKAINPKKMKSKVFRKNLEKEAKRVKDKVKEDYEKTTATWTRKPKFEGRVYTTRAGVSMEVYTVDEIYGYVDYGTKPHTIVPKNASVLRFPGTFSPKTMPGIIGSFQGTKGPPIIFTKKVDHPGTKPRNFSKKIYQKWLPLWRAVGQGALDLAAVESGHDP